MQAVANPAAPAAASAAALAAPDPGALLAWYDRHRRRLPWRAAPGRRQDPYRVFLSEIMLQQTTVVTVAPYYENFLRRWPTVAALAAAPLEEVLSAWAGLGYYARARNLHACARAVVEHHGGQFPSEEAALLALPGIGPYTAAAIAAIAFERRAAPVDGNWERVVSRLFAVEEALPKARPRLRALALTLLPAARYGDFAQAMMDLGATICTPRKPACALCPWQGPCSAHAGGAPERYPVKAAKSARPTRQGVAFLAVRADGAVLVRSRPPKGLLGGMSEVPSTPWEPGGVIHPAAHAPVEASWTALNATVTHVFSHFALELQVWRAELPASQPAPAGHRWVVPQGFEAEAFPSVMRKVLAHASPAPARKDYVCVNEPLRSRIVVPASRTSGSKQEMTTMGSTMDKAKGMGNEAMGNIKQGVGKATGSERLQAEGKVQELKGEAQQAKGEIKESVKKAGDL